MLNNSLINTGTINNTLLIQFGKENVYDLNRDEIKTIESSNTPYKQIIETFHFNPNRPQTQNIKCLNVNGKYLEIYDGNGWVKIPLDDKSPYKPPPKETTPTTLLPVKLGVGIL
jgi:hypothetical protein